MDLQGVRWARHVARMGERRRWGDNTKMDLQKLGCGGMDRIDLTQDRDRRRAFVNTVMNLRVPLSVGNFLTS